MFCSSSKTFYEAFNYLTAIFYLLLTFGYVVRICHYEYVQYKYSKSQENEENIVIMRFINEYLCFMCMATISSLLYSVHYFNNADSLFTENNLSIYNKGYVVNCLAEICWLLTVCILVWNIRYRNFCHIWKCILIVGILFKFIELIISNINSDNFSYIFGVSCSIIGHICVGLSTLYGINFYTKSANTRFRLKLSWLIRVFGTLIFLHGLKTFILMCIRLANNGDATNKIGIEFEFLTHYYLDVLPLFLLLIGYPNHLRIDSM